MLSFINPDTIFRNKKAFGIKLERIPKLLDVTKHNILTMVKSSKELGGHNVPRCFMVEGGKKVNSYYVCQLILFSMFACMHDTLQKQEKCTILVCDAFSVEVRNAMVDGKCIIPHFCAST